MYHANDEYSEINVENEINSNRGHGAVLGNIAADEQQWLKINAVEIFKRIMSKDRIKLTITIILGQDTYNYISESVIRSILYHSRGRP